MTEKIQKLKNCHNELFGDTFLDGCLIEIEDKEDEMVLSANRNGMLYLISRLIELCEHNKEWSCYHLDSAGMANKCNKPMVISLTKENY